MVERHPYKVDVAGSNPVLPTKLNPLLSGFFIFKTLRIAFAENELSSGRQNFKSDEA